MSPDPDADDSGENWASLVEALERKRSISALLYLGENGRTKEVSIRDEIFPNPQQTESQLGRLREAGLIDMERDEVPGTRRTAKFWSLTMAGQAVVNLLEVMELCAEGKLSPIRAIQLCQEIRETADEAGSENPQQ